MISLEINNKKVEVQDGTSIIDAADQHGIYIPRFCYHKKLSVVANCRICLVEVEGVKKTLPACATLVTSGMKVYTQSKAALSAQRAVMEFLLINHPLDCPICDQAGQCELQDLAMGFGHADSDFTMRKNTVASLDLGPLIATDMTRCIRCTRCIRVGTEICGDNQMGATERGVDTEIGPYIAQTITSPLSGNMIDVCPVGALTSKPDAAQSRPWELYEHKTLASHDCWGTHTFTHTKSFEYTTDKEVMRVVPRSCEAINEAWITDRDRFSYLSYASIDRAIEPMVKRNGHWVKPGLEAALLETADRLTAVLSLQSANRIGAICSPNATVEEGYILQKWMRAMESEHIDHRIRMTDCEYPDVFASIKPTKNAAQVIEQSDYILLIGSHLSHEVPLANLRVFKAYQNDARIDAINPCDYAFNYKITTKEICATSQTLQHVNALLNALGNNADEHPMAKAIKHSQTPTVILGHAWQRQPDAMLIYQLLKKASDLGVFQLVVLTEGTNSFGLSAAGVLPKHKGLSTQSMLLDNALDACVFLNVEPELDLLLPHNAITTLKQMPLVICLTPFVSASMLKYADIILPIAMPFEMAGTWVNAQGEWQSISPVTSPLPNVKPSYKFIQALAKLMNRDGFDQEHSKAILEECKAQLNALAFDTNTTIAPKLYGDITLNFDWPWLRVDASCRRSPALQAVQALRWASSHAILRMNATLAQSHGFKDQDLIRIFGVDQLFMCSIDPSIPDHEVCAQLGVIPTQLPWNVTTISLSKES
jgi:NADH-quinone oxidoreductase subunit G